MDGQAQGLPVWIEDAAGPYPALPQAGQSGCEAGSPSCQPHAYLRGTTATRSVLTLFHLVTGALRAKGVTNITDNHQHILATNKLARIDGAFQANRF